MEIKKYLKLISGIILITLVFWGIFYLAVYTFIPSTIKTGIISFKENVFNYFTEEKRGPFWTSKEYKKELEIEIIDMSSEENQIFHSMIEKIIDAEFRYYNTGDEKEFEKVKNLFLPEEYERSKRKINSVKTSDDKEFENYYTIPDKITEIKFSEPRTYKDLEGRIGIISSIFKKNPENTNDKYYSGKPYHIFIFKQVNNKWKIEKIKDFTILTKLQYAIQGSERNLIYAMISKIIELSPNKEQGFHSIIEKTIMAGFQYYDTGDDKEFEAVENMFSSLEEHELIKRRIHKRRRDCPVLSECKIPSTISLVYSQPRYDENLKNRIGMICSLPVAAPDFMFEGCPRCQPKIGYIFIFKLINNEWKIEKIKSYYSTSKLSIEDKLSESNLIQYWFEEIKKGL